MSPSLILGVDGGGSSTEAWLAVATPGAEGAVIGRGAAGPSNAKAVGLAAARAALEAAICGAFDSGGLEPAAVECACLGLAGFDRPEDRAVLTGWADEARLARRLVLVNDGDLVVAAGTPEGWGVGVIAGTGSIAVARSREGRTARAGGWGHLIGDEGSAYLVVLEALRLVARRADGREPGPASAGGGIEPASGSADPLTVRLCRALGVDRPSRIVTALYAPESSRAGIAAMAPEVLAACDESPGDAERLLRPVGAALGEIVAAAARSLDWPSGPLPLAAAGSFLLAAAAMRRAMLDDLLARGYEPALTVVPEPARGAVILAGRALDEWLRRSG
jgi:N-acetylglucosamine kinase-like BadF-type ATPase